MRGRTKQWQPGCVLRAKPRRDDVNFTNHRRRPFIVLSDWTCVPLTAGQCTQQHLLPNRFNGLRKPSDLLTNFRMVPTRGYAYQVIGVLSTQELQFVEQLSKQYPAKMVIELCG